MTSEETCLLVAGVSVIAMLINGAICHLAIWNMRRREHDQ